MSRNVVPKITRKRSREVAPAPNDWAIYNLRQIIPNKVERQRTAVDHKCDQTEQRQQNGRASEMISEQCGCILPGLRLGRVHLALGIHAVRLAHISLAFPLTHVTQVTYVSHLLPSLVVYLMRRSSHGICHRGQTRSSALAGSVLRS